MRKKNSLGYSPIGDDVENNQYYDFIGNLNKLAVAVESAENRAQSRPSSLHCDGRHPDSSSEHPPERRAFSSSSHFDDRPSHPSPVRRSSRQARPFLVHSSNGLAHSPVKCLVSFHIEQYIADRIRIVAGLNGQCYFTVARQAMREYLNKKLN